MKINFLIFDKVDQPGIGGKDITESNYLQKYGPGKFQFDLRLLTMDQHNIFNTRKA